MDYCNAGNISQGILQFIRIYGEYSEIYIDPYMEITSTKVFTNFAASEWSLYSKDIWRQISVSAGSSIFDDDGYSTPYFAIR